MSMSSGRRMPAAAEEEAAPAVCSTFVSAGAAGVATGVEDPEPPWLIRCDCCCWCCWVAGSGAAAALALQ